MAKEKTEMFVKRERTNAQRVMAMFRQNAVIEGVVYEGFCKAEILLVCRPNSYQVLPNVTKSLHVGKEARV